MNVVESNDPGQPDSLTLVFSVSDIEGMTAIGEATIMIGDTPDVAAVVDQRTDAIFVVSDVNSRGTSSIGPAIVVKDDDKFPTVRQIIVQLSGTEEERGKIGPHQR